MYCKQLMLAAIMLASVPANACDVCGSAGAANQFGILSGSNMHFIGFRYKYRLFQSSHPLLFQNEKPKSYTNHFSSYELWGRWAASRRIQVYGFLPYNTYQDEEYQFSGLGDVSLYTNYAVIDQTDTSNTSLIKRKLLVGAGIKAPTGNSDIGENEGTVLPNMQPGTGTWDYTLGLQYHHKIADWGFSVESNYKINGIDYYRRQFGNRWSSSITAFRAITLNYIENSLVPQLGVQYVNAAKDYRNVSKNEVNLYSGGHFLHATLGLDLILNKLTFNAKYHLPVWQDFALGYVENRLRLSFGVRVLIDNKK